MLRSSAWLGVGVLAFVADQLTKSAAFSVLETRGEIAIAPFFSLTFGMNSGVAFGLATQLHPALLIALTIAISAGIVMMILHSTTALRRLVLGMVLGAACGNIADRLRFGAVRDFLDLHWGGWRWPTFNLADAFITLGVLIIVFTSDTKRVQPINLTPASKR